MLSRGKAELAIDVLLLAAAVFKLLGGLQEKHRPALRCDERRIVRPEQPNPRRLPPVEEN